MDGILSVTPYYNKPTQEGLYQHFKAIADSTTLPIIVYSMQPDRSKRGAGDAVRLARNQQHRRR